MNDKVFKWMKENFAVVKDIVVVAFVLAVAVLNSHYVSVSKFEDYEKANALAHGGIQITLVNVDKTLALMAQNQASLLEHGAQIKINTGILTSLNMRVDRLDTLRLEAHMSLDEVRATETSLRLRMVERLLENMGATALPPSPLKK